MYFLGGGAGGLPLLWSPKQSHYCGSVGSVRGTLVLFVFFAFFLARFNKEFAVSGLGMVFKFQSFSWLDFGVNMDFGCFFFFFFFFFFKLICFVDFFWNFPPGQKNFQFFWSP